MTEEKIDLLIKKKACHSQTPKIAEVEDNFTNYGRVK